MLRCGGRRDDGVVFPQGQAHWSARITFWHAKSYHVFRRFPLARYPYATCLPAALAAKE
jgi:hypothetical protein